MKILEKIKKLFRKEVKSEGFRLILDYYGFSKEVYAYRPEPYFEVRLPSGQTTVVDITTGKYESTAYRTLVFRKYDQINENTFLYKIYQESK